MKIMAALAITMAFASGARAKDIQRPWPVIVCVEWYPNPYLLMKAEFEASLILAELPVRIEWTAGRACHAADAIHIQVEYRAPAQVSPGALAYALPYKGTYIDLFYDRIEKMIDSRNMQHLLAHVLAHEITHLLEGRPHHSETGVMKAHWSGQDMAQMKRNRLHFAPEDIKMVREAMACRAAGFRIGGIQASTEMPTSRLQRENSENAPFPDRD
jgi:hypothetical protein